MCLGQHKPTIGFHAVNPQAQAWMRRSMVNRNAQIVCDDVEQTLKQMRLLQRLQGSTSTSSTTPSSTSSNSSCHQEQPCLFHREDIEIGKLLGQGAFCQVHEVTRIRSSSHHASLQPHVENGQGCPWVIKHLRKDIVMKSTRVYQHAAADLVIESKILASLSHPNIIRIRGWASQGAHGFYYRKGTSGGGDGDGFFMILDKIDETLAQRLEGWRQAQKRHGIHHLEEQQQQQQQQQQPRIMAEKLGYAKQLVDALEYLHSHDMIFRDLKPDNIGFRGNIVQLFDFGLCRELPESRPDQDRVFTMSGVGTRRYLAPEVILGLPYNQKLDVYSWSMVLHEMLSLQKPFDWYGHAMHMELVVKGGERPKLPLEWPLPLQRLLQTAWAREPQDRPCMHQVQEKLQGIVDTMECLSQDESISLIRELAGLLGWHHPPSSRNWKDSSRLQLEGTERTSSVLSGSFSMSTC